MNNANPRRALSIREGLSLSRMEVCRRLARQDCTLDPSHLRRFELEGGEMGSVKLLALSHVYGCTVDELLAPAPEPAGKEA